MIASHDSPHDAPSRLDHSAVQGVRAALQRFLLDGADPAPLRAALTHFTAHARERRVQPEQLLVVLKEVWNGMPEVRAMHDVGDQVRMQQLVVTMCIKEYFQA
ncbi:MAG: hypothetical protein JWL60_2097 [Gemmatimonadetes bacterium]|jgi:hypothetical protein|nr:hypothetical protein [Gemmatimonadota bacterium]